MYIQINDQLLDLFCIFAPRPRPKPAVLRIGHFAPNIAGLSLKSRDFCRFHFVFEDCSADKVFSVDGKSGTVEADFLQASNLSLM